MKLTNVLFILKHLRDWLTIPDSDFLYTNPQHSMAAKSATVVVCIHGMADKAGAFNDLIHYLLPNLPPAISRIQSISTTGRQKGIPFFAKKVLQKVVASGTHDIILIGHSRGGIIAAYLAEYLAHKAGLNIRGIITIGSPFKGSGLIAYPLTRWSKSIEEMQLNSRFLQALERKLQHNQYQHRYLFISGEDDFIVKEHSAQIAVPLAAYKTLKDVGHLALLHSPALHSAIAETIAQWLL